MGAFFFALFVRIDIVLRHQNRRESTNRTPVDVPYAAVRLFLLYYRAIYRETITHSSHDGQVIIVCLTLVMGR